MDHDSFIIPAYVMDWVAIDEAIDYANDGEFDLSDMVLGIEPVMADTELSISVRHLR